MSKALLPLVAFLVALPSWAAPQIVGDHEVKPGGFAVMRVEGVGKTVLWTVTPATIQEEEIAGTLVFSAVPGEYTATAIIIDFDKKTVEKLKHRVVFLGGPGPSPVPPVPPVPPAPVDPLVSQLRDAAGRDGLPMTTLAAVGNAFNASADAVKNRTTIREAQAMTAAALTKAVGGEKVRAPALLALLSPIIDAALPQQDGQMTDALKVAASDLFKKLGRACLEAAK